MTTWLFTVSRWMVRVCLNPVRTLAIHWGCCIMCQTRKLRFSRVQFCWNLARHCLFTYIMLSIIEVGGLRQSGDFPTSDGGWSANYHQESNMWLLIWSRLWCTHHWLRLVEFWINSGSTLLESLFHTIEITAFIPCEQMLVTDLVHLWSIALPKYRLQKWWRDQVWSTYGFLIALPFGVWWGLSVENRYFS